MLACQSSMGNELGVITMMLKDPSWPFDMDLSSLDTGCITNILRDIENHLPSVESSIGVKELMRVKKIFESELMSVHRLH